jgi:TldD protein
MVSRSLYKYELKRPISRMNPDFYDIRTVRGRRASIVLDNGKVEEVTESIFQGAAVRSLLKGAWGFVRTDSLDDLDKKVETATRLAAGIKCDEDLRLLARKSGKSTLVPVKRSLLDLSMEEKTAFLMDVERTAKVDGVSSTRVFYFEAENKINYTDSEGLDITSEMTRTGFGISAVASRGGLLQSDSEIRAGVGGLEIFDVHDPFELAGIAGKTAVELLDSAAPKGGSFPVILDQELAGVFIHEAVGHAAEGDIVLEGGSVLEGKIGQSIGSDLVTVKDDPRLGHYGHYPFDDEGSMAEETVLVDSGIFSSYLLSRETAARLGGSPKNGRAQGTAKPVVRMSNTYMTNGDHTFEELLSELKNGVYLMGSRGGQVNTAEGVFQFNAKRGYTVVDGELSKPLRDVSLSGNTLEILKGVLAKADDLKFNSGGCGKSGQTVPVGDGSPHLLIRKATVGGTA